MPAFDVLIILFVFCGPGMLFWFFEGQAKHLRQERPFWLQVALGALVTLSYYAMLEGLGWISLGSIINKEGKVDARLIVGTANIMFYFGTIAAFSVVGFVVGKYLSDKVEVGLTGKDSKTAWLHAFGLTSKKYGYATLYTKDGGVWWGYVYNMPDIPDPSDVVVLEDAKFQFAGTTDFLNVDADLVAVPIGDIRAITMKYASCKKESHYEEESRRKHGVEVTAVQYFKSAEYIEYIDSFDSFEYVNSFESFQQAYWQSARTSETNEHRTTSSTVAGQRKGDRFRKSEINFEED